MSQLYTLGPLDSPTLVLTDTSQRGVHGVGAVDTDGVLWLCEYPTGWDDIDWQTPVDAVDGTDGALIAPQSVGPRTIGITGTLIAPTPAARAAAVRRLRDALPRRGPVRFAVTDEDDRRLWVDAYPSGVFRPVPRGAVAAIFSFALIAGDPYKRGDQLRTQTTGLPDPAAQPGVTFPATLPLLFGAGTGPTGGVTTCPNYGDADAWPTLTVTGPVVQPLARNTTTGAYLQWAITLPAGSAMTVDTATGRTTVDGVQRDIPLLGYSSDYWSLPPGTSEVEFRAVSAYDPAAALSVAWHDTHR